MRHRLIILGIVLFASPALAQEFVAVHIDKATIAWDAATGGGTPTTYHVKCGDTSGSYKHPQVDVPADRTTLAVKAAIPGLGRYFCVVTASNQFGESGPSNEISFDVGREPAAPTGTRLEAS
ncbi:MAG: fibronectin type III domain-containing protein [Rhodospirillales bacterium]